MTSHMNDGKPGSVNTDMGSLDMTKRDRDLAKRETGYTEAATRKEGTTMPNAVVMTGYGPPDVLKWAAVPLPEPGEGQIRIKVQAAGISPTDLALRAGYLKDAIPLPPDTVLGFEAAGTVDAVGPGVTGTSDGDAV